MNTIIVNIITDEMKKTVGEKIKKYGGKIVAGVICDVSVHFISKKIIETIEKEQQKTEE